ncbi:MAG: ATP-binding cassette domain-containing protein [Sporomusa sp.]
MLDKVDGGHLHLDGRPYESYRDKISIYQKIQIVFQHSSEALNPRLSVRDIIEEPLRYLTPLTGPARLQRTKEMLEAVRLEAGLLAAKPPELSGGQVQRVGLARALAPALRLVILDEPTSSLDIIIQRQILSLLGQLSRQTGTAFLMISHDLGAVCQVADRIAFIHDGRIVEQAASRAIDQVRHPIARRLVRSAGLPEG